MENNTEKNHFFLQKSRLLIVILFILIGIISALSILVIGSSERLQNGLILLVERIVGHSLDSLRCYNLNFYIRKSLLSLILAIWMAGLFFLCTYRKEYEESARLQNFICIITGVFSALLVTEILDNGHNWGGDFSQYIAQARAIATNTINEQIKNSSYIIDHSPAGLANVAYPWGFPMLLAPIYAIFGKNLFILKLPSMICFAVSVVYCNLLFRKHFTFFQAEIATLFIAANPVFIFFCNNILSDIPFFCFSIIALYYCERLFYSEKTKETIVGGILTGLFSFLAFLTKSMGIVFPCLFMALHILMFLTKKSKFNNLLKKYGFTGFSKPNVAAHIIPYIIFIALLAIQNAFLPKQGETQLNEFLQFLNIRTIINNCRYYFFVLKDFFPFGANLFYAWLIPFFIYGFIKNILKKPVLSIYTLGNIGIWLLWFGNQGIRYCFPAIPAMIIFTGLGLKDFFVAIQNENIKLWSMRLEMTILFLCMIFYTNKAFFVSNDYGAYSSDAKELYSMIINKTPDDSKIIFFKPRVLYLETGRLGFQTNDINRLDEADYLILSKDGYGTFDYDIESQYPDARKKLYKLFDNKTLKCYKIIPPTENMHKLENNY